MDRRPHPKFACMIVVIISMHDCCEDDEDDEDSNEIELAPKINTYKVNEYLEEVHCSTFLKAEGMQWKLLKQDPSWMMFHVYKLM